ncbi:MAG: tetratricopeptide repeat protein [Euryarchaeota archaeon]|nr:tetratricopeptide repeat protein [Euryarchaeota archaeon]
MGLWGRGREGPAAPVQAANPAEEQFQRAMALANQERHAEALSAFRRVLELDPRYQPEMVRYGMALALEELGDSDRAVTELENVLSINPAHVDARFMLGTIHARRNRLEHAIQEYEAVLRMRPGHELAGEMKRSIARWRLDLSGGPIARFREELSEFIAQAERRFSVRLDFTEESLRVLDGLIDGGWTPAAGGVGVLHLAGTYIGEVMVRNLGGRWSVAPAVEESEITGLGATGIRPFFIALDKFRRGRAAPLYETYQAIRAQLGGAGAQV